MKPHITKLGTIDVDLIETTPIVFKGMLYRFEYVQPIYWNNDTGESFFRFVEHGTGRVSAPFGHGYHYGNVMVDDDTLVVTGARVRDDRWVDILASRDMEHWETWNALDLPGWGLFNTSLCRAEDRYVLMVEVGKPEEVAGVRFTARFATSTDLHRWEMTPPECTYAKDRYTAPHCLRYLDGYYYNFYLEIVGDGFEQYVVRSHDLVEWELSPLNPVLKASPEDHQIANPAMPPEHQQRVRTATNINNSDIDFCEHQGQLIINYSWGTQRGTEHLAEAVYPGPLSSFLTGWFPE